MLFKRKYKKPPDGSVSRQEMRDRQQAIISNAAFSAMPKTTSVIQDVPDMRIYSPKGSTMPSMSITQTAINAYDYQWQHEEENRRMLTRQSQHTYQAMLIQQNFQMFAMRDA